MTFQFAVIVNDTIQYCSSEQDYSKFEIVIFANLLIKQISEDRSWSLHKLLMQSSIDQQNLKLLVRRQISEDRSNEILFCLLGELKLGSAYAYEILDKFQNQIMQEYSIENLDQQLRQDLEGFESLCSLMSATLFSPASKEMITRISEHETFEGLNQVIYAGISTNGLPIASKIFSNQTIFNIENDSKQDLMTTMLSGQLATIAINSFIRAQSIMKSIQIQTNETENNYIFFNFAQFGYSREFVLETLCAGNPYHIERFSKEIKEEFDTFEIFREPFTGALKNYNFIQEIFNELPNKLNGKINGKINYESDQTED